MPKRSLRFSLALCRLSICSASAQVQHPKLSVLGTFRAGPFDEGAAEIVAHDPASQRLFVVNGADRTVDILDMKTPSALRRIAQISIPSEYGRAANSLAVRNGIVAVAVEAYPKTDPGTRLFLNTEGRVLNTVQAGALPDKGRRWAGLREG